MALPRFTIHKMMRQARWHVQIRISAVGPIEGPLCYVPVRGTVTRVFSGKGLSKGEEVEFHVPVRVPPALPEPGPGRWVSDQALINAEFMELYLDGEPSNPTISGFGYLYEVVPDATSEPQMPTPTLLQVWIEEAGFHWPWLRRFR